MALETIVEFNNEKNLWDIKLDGDLDIYTSNDFRNKVIQSFEQKEVSLNIDGEKLKYIDSTGLGVLISILKILQEKDKEIYIENIKPNIRKIFDITELDKLFVIRGENNA